jgi:hypothetical protein
MRIPMHDKMVSEFARAKFATNGRGAVVIDEGGVIQTNDGVERHGTVLAYLYEASDLFDRVGRTWPGTTGVAVETYDPAREMVVIHLDKTGALEAYLLPLLEDEEPV